jgi:ankyrin repeat protein
VLLAHDAEINAKSKHGKTACGYADQNGHTTVAALLLSNGAIAGGGARAPAKQLPGDALLSGIGMRLWGAVNSKHEEPVEMATISPMSGTHGAGEELEL